MAGIPPALLAKVQLHPVEDIVLAVLRDGLDGIHVQSLIEIGQQFPLVTARRTTYLGDWKGDGRGLVDSADLNVEVFVEEPNADEDAALLSEIVRTVLYESCNRLVIGKGYISKIEMSEPPHYTPDWANSVGPVQYADLPTGLCRYETSYRVRIRTFS